MAIFRSGLRALLPPEIELISGPGCPVCVTSESHIDAFLQMAELPGTHLAVFGNLRRVPGSNGATLAHARARDAQIDVVYSRSQGHPPVFQKNVGKYLIIQAPGFEK